MRIANFNFFWSCVFQPCCIGCHGDTIVSRRRVKTAFVNCIRGKSIFRLVKTSILLGPKAVLSQNDLHFVCFAPLQPFEQCHRSAFMFFCARRLRMQEFRQQHFHFAEHRKKPSCPASSPHQQRSVLSSHSCCCSLCPCVRIRFPYSQHVLEYSLRYGRI